MGPPAGAQAAAPTVVPRVVVVSLAGAQAAAPTVVPRVVAIEEAQVRAARKEEMAVEAMEVMAMEMDNSNLAGK